MNLTKLQELAKDLPDEYKANAEALLERMGEVLEGIGDEPIRWRPGILKLVQAVSDRSKLPKGASIGSLVLGEEVVDQPLKVIVLRSWKNRQYWSPDQNEAKMLCSSPDAVKGYIGNDCATCPHSQFVDNKTECNKLTSFLVIKADFSDIFVVNFSKTNYMEGDGWQKTMKKAMVATYKRIYGLKSQTSAKNKNVEAMQVETFDKEAATTPAALIPFLTELFVQVGEDRKEQVDNFHKILLTRSAGQAAALAAPSTNADSDMVLIGSEATEVEAKPAAKTSDTAKKYVV